MKALRWLTIVALAALLWVAGAPSHAAEMTGFLEFEYRYFLDDPFDPRQFEGGNASVAGEWEIYDDWDNGRQGMTFKIFGRLDQHDDLLVTITIDSHNRHLPCRTVETHHVRVHECNAQTPA